MYRHWIWALTGLLMWPGASRADLEHAPAIMSTNRPPVMLSTNRTPILSTSRLFHVAGGVSSDNLSMATFADDVHDAMVTLMGRAAPQFSRDPILITLREADGRPRVERYQRYVDRALQQELVVIQPALADQEHVLESIVWCLLNRYALLIQDNPARYRAAAECPEWFSTGIAQRLFTQSTNRNRALLQSVFVGGEMTPMDDIVSWSTLPDQRPMTHAVCDLQVQWMRSEIPDLLSEAIRHMASGQGLDRRWMMDRLDVFTDREMDMKRDLFLAGELMPFLALRPYAAKDIRTLQGMLNLEPPVFDLFFDSSISAPRTIPDLLRTVPERAARETLRVLVRDLRKLNAGKTGPLQLWCSEFTTFLDTVISQSDPLSEETVKKLLDQWQTLEQKRKSLMVGWLDQDRYLDRFEP